MSPEGRTGQTDHARRGIKTAIILAVLIFGLIVFLESDFFNLRNIVIEGCQIVTRSEIMALSGLGESQNILSVSPKAVCDRLAKDPRIRSAVVERQLPNTVTIRIQERIPLYRLPMDNGWAVASSDNYIIYSIFEEDRSIPVISGIPIQTWRLGQKIEEPLLLAAGDFLNNAVPGLLSTIVRVDIQKPEQIYMELSSGVILELGNTESVRRKMEAAAVILSDNERKNRALQTINVRSPENPVVKLAD